MIGREILILLLVFAGFASVVSAYLLVIHDSVSLKDTLSNAFAGTVGVYVGRYLERRLICG